MIKGVIVTKHLFLCIILPFSLFSNASFAKETEDKVVISETKETIFNEMSTTDKLKIGSSGVLDLISKMFGNLGELCTGISVAWFGLLCGDNDIKIIELIPKNLYGFMGAIVFPGGVGCTGLASTGIHFGLDYLSKKVMPSEKQSQKVVVIKNSEESNVKNYKHLTLKEHVLDATK